MSPVPKQYKAIINWGNSTSFTTLTTGVRVFNVPTAIRLAANKLLAFGKLRDAGVRIPEFTTDAPASADAIWLARTVLSGSSGDGIVVVRKGDKFPAAPLYVKYVPKVVEYRVHVAGGKAIFIQAKKKKVTDAAEQSKDEKLIRNYDNGWVFCPIEMHLLSDVVKDEAVKAVKALGLDFGAVDMIIGKKDGLPYILEINTAPGLESPGLIAAYTDYFKGAVTL